MTSKEALSIIKNSKSISFNEAYAEPLNTIEKDLERLGQLEKNYYSLNREFETIEFENYSLRKENEKLKQVIENIKKLPNCDICDENWHKGCMCLQKKIKEVLNNE